MWREDIWALQIELFTGRSESFQLFLASADHPVADFGRTFRLVGRTHFFVVHGGDIDVNVDAIHERTGNLGDVALDHRRGALAIAGAVIVESARAGIHGGGQHKARGKRERHGGAGNRDRAILKWLPQDFEHVAGKLGEFVEKKQAIMGERNFAGARDHAAADQPSI